MRARTVNEAQEFERGKNPKQALGVGGLDLFKDIERRLDELDYEIGTTKFGMSEEWAEDLQKMLVGKTITADMKKLPKFDTKTKKQVGKWGQGEFTIKVVDVKSGEDLSTWYDNYKRVGFSPQILLADDKGNMYSLQIREDQKIHFDES